jgi:hypothetical protein
VLDAVIMSSVDVKFELIWRRGSTDMPLATWTEHYDATGGGNFDAQAHEYDQVAPAIDFASGDKFVFRYSAVMALGPEAYIPNGDGALARGRIPNFTLPK